MGITIECKKTGTSLDLGYFGFNRFRNKVAFLYSDEFGKHNNILSNPSIMFLQGEERKEYYEKYDNITLKMINEKRLDIKIANFIYQPDCEGKIQYGACKNIYNVIKDYDDDICYGYAGRKDCAMFRDLKSLIKECYDNKSDLVWR